MKKKTPVAPVPSMPTWETLETFMRTKIQATLQGWLEEEVAGFLGRGPSVRQAAVDGSPGYRNGYGEPRRVALSCGTVTVRRPRIRGVQALEERFESRVLPLFRRRTEELGALLPELYLHGLAQGDFELAMRGFWARARRCRRARSAV